MQRDSSNQSGWSWIPTLYFTEGIPYVVVMSVSVIMYKRLGISNAELALYTSWLYLPWVIKPIWSPILELFKTKRFWVVAMQLLIGAGFAGVAFTIPTSSFFQYTLAFFWLAAFSSATHDIAADGFYMMGLNQQQQSFFVGIRSFFYRLAMITGQGLLVVLAGYLEANSGLPPLELEVHVRKSAQEEIFLPFKDEINPHSQEDLDVPLMLQLSSKVVFIPLGKSLNNREDIEADVEKSIKWNYDQGFSSREEQVQLSQTRKSWWQTHVSIPLGQWLSKRFGPKTINNVVTEEGHIKIVELRLSRKLLTDQPIVVNIYPKSRNPSIRLLSSNRFTFNRQNQNHIAKLVFQADPKLEKATEVTFQLNSGDVPFAWRIVFLVIAAFLIMIGIFHAFILPRPVEDQPSDIPLPKVGNNFLMTFQSFFSKPHIGISIAFLLFYRFSEAQLVKLSTPFLLDTPEVGGLGLSTASVGFVYGTVGVLALILGGILGGVFVSRHGLRFWLWPMLVAINLPNGIYVFLAYFQPENLAVISTCIGIEQFGYGFGFTAYMMYMIYISQGSFKTAHYAMCTGFMALGMMIPGMFSGWLQEHIGYQHFFIWIVLSIIPSFLIAAFVHIDKNFGRTA